ncbi:hypothetical protein ANANG_G00283360 [Anguilla anguilla]|uniref:RLR CTR domain-containing protein n=1 Tax=Anguilla anguilla TaxID=7936 RepID=A0A9D3LNR6_ANGAN|nr:hypothetical protein ANANG_G00283360 [Anguilla anguilla]
MACDWSGFTILMACDWLGFTILMACDWSGFMTLMACDWSGIYYKAGAKVELDRTFEDWEPGREISCANCGKEWGMEMIYKEVTLPNLGIKNFVLDSLGHRQSVKKWKDVPFCVEDFKYTDYVLKKFPDLL